MKNGEITFDLPKNVDSHFLRKIDSAPSGMKIEPLGVEVWLYTDAFRLIDNGGNYIGNVWYEKENNYEYHWISYCYFSKDAKINGITYDEDEMSVIYEIDAKKGWNKFYMLYKENSSMLITTDLSKVPDGLKWIVEEFNN